MVFLMVKIFYEGLFIINKASSTLFYEATFRKLLSLHAKAMLSLLHVENFNTSVKVKILCSRIQMSSHTRRKIQYVRSKRLRQFYLYYTSKTSIRL
ncbi:hypothetical protein F8M41_019612 [Gigaspora margarita]|uniref:Uncharacterized protein n=1 Tax=Gigaspora margarita TaxID=4874 RepID=A0A8H4AJP2_GIGMA|nr:hypothetical protein F8M41_019612 [Gigaspora margarita]